MKTHCDTTIWLGSDGATVEVTAVETCAWAHLGSHVLIHTDGTNLDEDLTRLAQLFRSGLDQVLAIRNPQLALVPAAEDERS